MKKIIVVSLFLIISGFTPQLKSLFVQETFAMAAFGTIDCGTLGGGPIKMKPGYYPGPYFGDQLCQDFYGTETDNMEMSIEPNPSIIYDKVSKG